jgi:hypothetical protein
MTAKEICAQCGKLINRRQDAHFGMVYAGEYVAIHAECFAIWKKEHEI